MIWRKALPLGVLLLLVVALLGCSSQVTPAAPNQGSGQVASPTAAAVTPQVTALPGVTVTDALGRTLYFDIPPQRIVIAGRASILLADAVYAFTSAPEKVVALTKAKQGMDFLALVDPQVGEKAVLGPESSPEAIAAHKPDVVLMKAFLADKLGRIVENLGIPVFYLSLETPEAYPQELAQLGALMGEPERGQALAAYYLNKMNAVTEAVADLPAPGVLVLQHSVKGGETAYLVPPKPWIQTQMVRLAGGTPLWAEEVSGGSWTVVDAEQIAAWNPEVILLIDYFGSPLEAVQALDEGGFGPNLKAVQAHQVWPFPKDFLSWDQPDTRWILGLMWTAKQLHPDRFADLDILAESDAFYRTLYGLDEVALAEVRARLAANAGLK